METALTISQIVFFSVFSLAIIVCFFMMIAAGSRIISIIKTLDAIVKDVHDMSDEARERIREVSEKLSLLPILSMFVRRARANRGARRKVDKK